MFSLTSSWSLSSSHCQQHFRCILFLQSDIFTLKWNTHTWCDWNTEIRTNRCWNATAQLLFSSALISFFVLFLPGRWIHHALDILYYILHPTMSTITDFLSQDINLRWKDITTWFISALRSLHFFHFCADI